MCVHDKNCEETHAICNNLHKGQVQGLVGTGPGHVEENTDAVGGTERFPEIPAEEEREKRDESCTAPGDGKHYPWELGI